MPQGFAYTLAEANGRLREQADKIGSIGARWIGAIRQQLDEAST